MAKSRKSTSTQVNSVSTSQQSPSDSSNPISGEASASASNESETQSESIEPSDVLLKEVARREEQNRVQLAKVMTGFESLQSRIESENGLIMSLSDLRAEFEKSASLLMTERQIIEIEKSRLVLREHAISKAEQDRDQGYSDQRLALENELSNRRSKQIELLESELTKLRSDCREELSLLENTELDRIRLSLKRERDEWDELRTAQQATLQLQQEEVERQKGAIYSLQSKLEGRQIELENNELNLEELSNRLNQQVRRRIENLEEELSSRMEGERRTFEARLIDAADHEKRLRETLQSQGALLSGFEQIQQQLGGREPASVISELKTLNELLARQREELATRPTEETRMRLNDLELEKTSLQSENDNLRRQIDQNRSLVAQSSEMNRRNNELESDLRASKQNCEVWKTQAVHLEMELKRLRTAEISEIQDRYNEIKTPRFKREEVMTETQPEISESDWLEGVAKKCSDYGLHFHPRIINAFHTALKTAEWSPITVLAGVSGTGKSELPRLYSHFGGLYNETLSVQPNWDSQESMLGFFNSIDNRFDAQPVLRFLAQSQENYESSVDGYPGLSDAMCLVLLDEMNLAHPELYFAEFLSKLELRRGKTRSEVPELQVKIGAGMEPYPLPLGRNVLWVGTMNQDETTKSLSDKVLDRSIIIYFPRPTDLKRRKKLLALNAKNRGLELPRSIWENWIVRESTFSDEEIKPYKAFIEEMNNSLSAAGRAIGHRVWQSIEYYMANYPGVTGTTNDSATRKKAMHIAFEDQLVQKVMPKLRGIDTRGTSRSDCLDKIRAQLVSGLDGTGFQLERDFDLAMDLGYGQFMWQSAKYLEEDTSVETMVDSPEHSAEGSDATS